MNAPFGGTHGLDSIEDVDLARMDTPELTELAAKVRAFLLDTIAQTGGHIGANLGTVELTIALDRTFGGTDGRVVWDTGHQGYTHKILTGRASGFASLNTYGGMNRFLSRTEHESDVLEASHAGTSVSVALGLALAKRAQGLPGHAVAVFGDGALAEGLLLEALNHAAVEGPLPLVLVLNDNGFAISPGFGGLHEYLQGRPVGSRDPETFFSSFGFGYSGPVDGHDIGALCDAFEAAKAAAGSAIQVVHVKTEKGRGLAPAADHPYRMHFSFPFDPETGKPLAAPAGKAVQDVAAQVLLEEMRQNPKIVAITPSTRYATGLDPAFAEFPDRCFDPGMEEQHAMTLSVGLGLEGMTPVLFYQSTFMQRAYDQLFHDVCFTNLPTLILSVRVGFAGYDNPTHHGIYETSYVRSLPNLTVLYPKDAYELERMTREALRNLSGPTLIEMPYGPAEYLDDSSAGESFDTLMRPEVLCSGSDLCILSVGSRFADARAAMEALADDGVSCGLVNVRRLLPLPEDELAELLGSVPRAAVVEEGLSDAGVGSAVAGLITDRGLATELLRAGVPRTFVEPGSVEELTRIYRLDRDGIVGRIRERWADLRG